MIKKFNDEQDKTAMVSERRFKDVSSVDAEILQLLAKRTMLLKREGSYRRAKGKGTVDPHLERRLREAFEREAAFQRLDPKITKQFFLLMSQFPLAEAAQKPVEDETEGYKLAPRREAAHAEVEGPRSLKQAMLWLAMAASCGQEIELAPAPVNATLKDFGKTLRGCGGRVDWRDDRATTENTEPLNLENIMVNCAGNKFAFYIMLALGLGSMGRIKYTGKPELQMMDQGGLSKLLPKLGARLASMNPSNPGLPVRLECGGPMEEEISFPSDVDPLFAPALTLAAWTFPGGLTIADIPEEAMDGVREAAEILVACGIDVEIDGNEVTVSDGLPELPSKPALKIDPELAAYTLAIPAVCNGDIAVKGRWPESTTASLILRELGAMGLDITVNADRIISRAGTRVHEVEMDMGGNKRLEPLAVALGLRAGDARIAGQPSDDARDLLVRLSANHNAGDDELIIQPGDLQWENAWQSPSPYWSIGCALIAWQRPGIMLSNHGEVTAVWPQFWNFYNSLPSGKMKPKPVKEENNDKRRRIRVSR